MMRFRRESGINSISNEIHGRPINSSNFSFETEILIG